MAVKRAKPTKFNTRELYKRYKRAYTKYSLHRKLSGDALQQGMMSYEQFNKYLELQGATSKTGKWADELATANAKRAKEGKKAMTQRQFAEKKVMDMAYKQYHGTSFTRGQQRALNSKSKKLLAKLELGAKMDTNDLYQAFLADYGPKYERATGESRWNLIDFGKSSVVSRKMVSLFNEWLKERGYGSYARAEAISTYVFQSE